jgi:hypothetical protein
MSAHFRVHVHGVAHFSQQIPNLFRAPGWEISSFSPLSGRALLAKAIDLGKCDLAFTYGGRITMGKFLRAAQILGKDRVVIFWAGSDILYARKDFTAGRKASWIYERVHWAASPWIADEARSIGLPCEYVPFNWAPDVRHPSPLPEKFSVLTYLPDLTRGSLYGADKILEVARAMPTTPFVLVGLREGKLQGVPPNVELHGWTSDLTPFYKRCAVLWRPVKHDGMSFMVLAALAHGRHVLYTYPFPGCIQSSGAASARIELERLKDLHATGHLGLNETGRKTVTNEFSPEAIRAGVLGRWKAIIEEKAWQSQEGHCAEQHSGNLPV